MTTIRILGPLHFVGDSTKTCTATIQEEGGQLCRWDIVRFALNSKQTNLLVVERTGNSVEFCRSSVYKTRRFGGLKVRSWERTLSDYMDCEGASQLPAPHRAAPLVRSLKYYPPIMLPTGSVGAVLYSAYFQKGADPA